MTIHTRVVLTVLFAAKVLPRMHVGPTPRTHHPCKKDVTCQVCDICVNLIQRVTRLVLSENSGK